MGLQIACAELPNVLWRLGQPMFTDIMRNDRGFACGLYCPCVSCTMECIVFIGEREREREREREEREREKQKHVLWK